MDPLKNPNPSLLVKLGSIAVHADEATEPLAHGFDIIAIRSLVNDPEVKEWLVKMAAVGLVPKKRWDAPTPPKPKRRGS